MESQQAARGFGLAPVMGLRTGRWLWEASPADHLWNVEADPEETQDLGATNTDTVKRLRGLRDSPDSSDSGPAPAIDEATRERLQALGYAVSRPERASGTDVRGFLRETADWCFKVTSLAAAGKYERAETFARKCLDRQPQAIDVWVEAGFVSIGLGDWKEAEHRFRTALGLRADYLPARLNLANVLWQRGGTAEAEAEYRKVLDAAPADPFALYNLGRLLRQAGRASEARPFWQRFMEHYPDHPRAAEVAAALQAGR